MVSGCPKRPGCLGQVWEAEDGCCLKEAAWVYAGHKALWTQINKGSNPGSITCCLDEIAVLLSVS